MDVSPLKCRTRFIKKIIKPYLLWSYNLQLQSLHPNELSRVTIIILNVMLATMNILRVA